MVRWGAHLLLRAQSPRSEGHDADEDAGDGGVARPIGGAGPPAA